MNRVHSRRKSCLGAVLAAALLPLSVAAAEDLDSLKRQIEEAAEWKRPNSLAHLAGYADVGYTDSDKATGTFNAGRFAPIFHYQYRDLLMVEAELEFQAQENGETEVGMEYLTADLFINDYMVLVAGKFLSPLGQFRQNLHPSWINKLPSAPAGFGHDQAAPNADVGVQLRGGFPLSGVSANYAVYVANGPAVELNEDGDAIERVETPGMGQDGDGSKVFGGRFGVYFPNQKLDLGLSLAGGRVSEWEPEKMPITYENKRDYSVFGADAIYRVSGFDLRAEYVQQKIGSSATSTAPESAGFTAWYGQGAYRLNQWEPVLRYAKYETPESEVSQWTVGVNYLFASNVIAKLAYELNDYKDADANNRLLLQLAYGF